MNPLVIILLGLLLAQRGPAELPESTKPESVPYEIDGPLQYGDQHPAQTLQVNFYPEGPPRPAMIYVFSGGWHSAPLKSKRATPPLYVDLDMSYVIMTHRTGWKNAHPAQVNDVTAGLRYVKENAPKWNIDPDRIAVTGTSSGAHLAMMVAYQKDSPGVAAVVSRGGPTDLSFEFLDSVTPDLRPHVLSKMKTLFGPAYNDPQAARAWTVGFSPVTYMSKDDPPTLFISFRRDPLPPPERLMNYYIHHPSFAEHGYQTLKDAGGHAQLAIIDIGPEGDSDASADTAEAAFLKKYLLDTQSSGAQ
jgi:acetyl esterase/lipase